MTALSHAIVTPSYSPDLERCALLVESLGRIGGDHPHYIIVDRRDVPAFRHLASNRTFIVETESIQPSWLHRLPGTKAYWLSLRAPPVRGWIMQQLNKIAIASVIPHDVLIFCDSDLAFFRPFTVDNLMVDGKVELLDVDYTGGWPLAWIEVACRLLGIDSTTCAPRNYVGQMICWRRENILAMQRRIEQVTGKSWQLALARQLHFSEYILYGLFVRDVLGYPQSGHVPSATPFIQVSWQKDLREDEAMDAFFEDMAPETVGAMVHSKDGIDPARIRARLERLWALSDAS